MKEFISGIAVVLTFVGYIPYMRDTIQGKTRPHVYTWFVWGLVPFIIFALQVSDNAGAGSYVTLASGVVCMIIFGLGLRQGKKDITLIDTALFISSFIALGLWVFAKQPLLSTTLLVSVDVLAFIPTVRKSWNRPEEETVFSYVVTAVRHGLGIIALERYTIITAAFPVTWTIVNTFFVLFLVLRRMRLKLINK